MEVARRNIQCYKLGHAHHLHPLHYSSARAYSKIALGESQNTNYKTREQTPDRSTDSKYRQTGSGTHQVMSSFRASPWVSYEPPAQASSHRSRLQHVSEVDMDEDVDMDGPLISTLHEDFTGPKKASTSPKKRPPVRAQRAEGDDEEDELVDELMDDNADPLGRGADTSQKRKATVKRKPRKEKKPGELEKKVKDKMSQPTGAHNPAPTMTWFKATPTSYEDTDTINSASMALAEEASSAKGKKKAAPRKTPAVPRPKIKISKQKSAIPPLLLEDTGTISESYAGTAASSPVTVQYDQNSPEPEPMHQSSPPPISSLLMEETLEGVPIPVYPLPTKPFPVQPPPKIPTGFAPTLPLDKSGRKVRHWREANREIRGIAGGRWLARTWVGEKESDYASYINITNAQVKPVDDKTSGSAFAHSKLSSASAVPTKALGKIKGTKNSSASTSVNPSRAPSTNPEGPGTLLNTSAVRAPTKMRILQVASDDGHGADSEITAPVGA